MSEARKRRYERLQGRKVAIETRLFESLVSSTLDYSQQPQIWVDRSLLVRFLSCADGMEDVLQRQPLLQNKEFMCVHGGKGLHPRVAKRGKVLPRSVYDVLTSVLLDERGKRLRSGFGQSFQESKLAHVCDRLVTVDSSLFCQDCVTSYKKELKGKEKSLTHVLHLYDSLDSTIDKKGNSTIGEVMYAVSRNFITSFRKAAEKLMKDASSPGVLNEGIDQLNLSFLPEYYHDVTASSSTEAKSLNNQGNVGNISVDPRVNTKITCSHLRSNVLKNKRTTCFVSKGVWDAIKELFPEAICHQRFKTLQEGGVVLESFGDGIIDGRCIDCLNAKADSVKMIEDVKSWGYQCIFGDGQVPSKLHDLYSWDTSKGLIRHLSMPEQPDRAQFRLVLHTLVQSWRSAVTTTQSLLSKRRGAISGNEVRQIILDVFSPTLLAERDLQGSRISAFKNVICAKHGLTALSMDVIRRMLTSATSPDGGIKSGAAPASNLRTSSQVEVLLEEEYCCLVRSLRSLELILGSAVTNGAFPNTNPLITIDLNVMGSQASPSISESGRFRIKANPPCCEEESCLKIHAPNIPSDTSNCSKVDVEVVGESGDSDLITVKIYELEESVKLEEALTRLLPEIDGKRSTEGKDEEMIRRSTRKRNARNEGIVRHEIRLNPRDNLAKLRLLLVEQRNRALLNQEFRLVSMKTEAFLKIETHHEDSTESVMPLKTTELVGDEKSICDYVFDANAAINDATDVQQENILNSKLLHMILRYRVRGGIEGRKSKRMRREEKQVQQMEEDSLMIYLTDIANASRFPIVGHVSTSGTTNRVGRHRREERGFHGTFLMGMSSLSDTGVDSNDIGTVACGTLDDIVILDDSAKEGLDADNAIDAKGDYRRSDALDDTVTLDDSAKEGLDAANSIDARNDNCRSVDLDDTVIVGHSAKEGLNAVNAVDARGNNGRSDALDDTVIVGNSAKERLNAVNDAREDNSRLHGDPDSTETYCAPQLKDAKEVIDLMSGDESDAENNNHALPPSVCGQQASGVATTQEVGLIANNPQQGEMANGNGFSTSVHDLSTQALTSTRPVYSNASPPMEDEDGTHLCCELDRLTKGAAIAFITKMKEKPDSFWEDKNIYFNMCQAVSFYLPKLVAYRDGRQLYRNFADSPDPFNCSCAADKNLRISRREMDIMLYYVSKNKKARDCQWLMPYRSERGLRKVFDTIKKFHDESFGTHYRKVYIENVVVAVERLVTLESSADAQDDRMV